MPSSPPQARRKRSRGWFALALALLLSGSYVFLSASEPRAYFRPPSGINPHGLRPDMPLSKGMFLVAHHGMRDPRFTGTVILLTDYGLYGAMGLIINRPTELKLTDALHGFKGLTEGSDTIYYGGPVKTSKMFILIRSKERPEGAAHVFGDVYVSTSMDLLERILSGEEKRGEGDEGDEGDDLHVYAGHAGWGPGQLDQEVSIGVWRVLKTDQEYIFDKTPEEVWQGLAGHTGR
jgi:putative transcriptional regulator